MALDPNPAPGPSPLTRRENHEPQAESKPSARDYFNAINSASRNSPIETEKTQHAAPPDSPADSGHSSQPNSPHIAYQERGRQLSSDITDHVRKKKDASSINAVAHDSPRDSPTNDSRPGQNGETKNNKFMLQEVPKSKKSEKRNSRSDSTTPLIDTTIPASKVRSAPSSANNQLKEQQITISTHESPVSSRSDATLSGSPRDTPQGSRSHTSADSPNSHSSPLGTQLKTLPERGDSLVRPSRGKQSVVRRDVDTGVVGKLSTAIKGSENGYEKPTSAPPTTTTQASALAAVNANKGVPRPQDSPSTGNFNEAPPPPLRARERLALQNNSSSDSFITPRAPPHPPTGAHKAKNESVGTMKSESLRNGDQGISPKLSRNPTTADSTMDEDTSRAINVDGQQDQGGFLRRVSHSVRHARSYSDRGTRHSKEQKWPKSPLVGSHSPGLVHEISSPSASSPETREELMWFKNELRRERQKTAERDQRLMELEATLEAKTTIKQMNTELREKRSTMVVLDTQKEIVVRELEVLTEHIAAAKKSGEPLDVGGLSNAVLREFAESLQTLKDSFSPQIEDLTQQRNDILEELSNLTQLKEKGVQEFEQLTLKNAQLADLNNQLVHQIQELYKANAGPALDSVRPPPNGLGIYTHHPKDRSNISMDSRDPRPSLAESNMTGSTVVQDQEVEPGTYLPAPQVVDIRKAQPKKFNWKKGGHNVAKGVTKGLKGAFSSDGGRNQREGQYLEGTPYGAMQQQDYTSGNYSRNQGLDRSGQGFGGFFGNPKSRPQQWKNSPNGSVTPVTVDGIPGECLPVRGKSTSLLIV